MNKYVYARTYLRLLLGLVALVVIVGLAYACIQLARSVSDVHDYRISEHAPLIVDTTGLVNELDAASAVVRSFTSKSNSPNYAIELKKHNIEIGKAVQLKPEQINGFESCLQIARNDSQELKTKLLEEFRATLNDIRTSVQAVLRNDAGQGPGTSKVETPPPKAEQPSSEKEPRRPLYSHEALDQMQFDELNAAISYLKKGPQNDVGNYISPQTEMRTAADELRALLQLIQTDLNAALAAEQKGRLGTDIEETPPLMTTSAKMAILRRFLNELSICEQLAKVNISRGWIVDVQIEKAENGIKRFQAEQKERLSYLRSDTLDHAMLAVAAIVSTAIVALLLLIIRDFFSAFIDTAVNTASTADTLNKIRNAATGDEAPDSPTAKP